MKAFLSLIGKQIRIGTLIALFGGGLLGLFLGTLLVSFENAQLLFEDISIRIHTIIFLASMCALISAALFFPLELGVACGLKIWPNLSKVSAKRFYLSSFVIGIALAHAFLWLNFNFVRNITSPKGIALSLGLFLAALGLLVTLIRIHSKSTAYNDAGPRAWFLACLIALFTGLSMISYHSLASHPKLSASATNATVSHETQSLTLTHSSSTRWNVILISIDTLRSDHLSCYGYSRQTAPHIDRLAKDGILFRNTRSQAPWTLPSHASMLTSLYPSSHGARFYSISRFLGAGTTVKLADRNVTLAEILQGAGCRTAAFTSVPWLSRTLGFGQGFDKIEMDVWAHTATTLVDKAIAWVGGSKTHPFFLFLHFMDVHNYTSPAEYDERYQNTNYNGRLKTQKLEIGANLYEVLSNDDLQYLVAKYDGALSYVDFELGRFFTWLRKTDQYDKTLIVITSDHGEEFWDHSGTGHGFTLYEDQLRVPLVIKLPAEFPIRDHEQHSLVGVIDIAPTVLDYLNQTTRDSYTRMPELRSVRHAHEAKPAAR